MSFLVKCDICGRESKAPMSNDAAAHVDYFQLSRYRSTYHEWAVLCSYSCLLAWASQHATTEILEYERTNGLTLL